MTMGEWNAIWENRASYPAEIRKLIRDYDKLCDDWADALTVLESHRLKNDLKRARKARLNDDVFIPGEGKV